MSKFTRVKNITENSEFLIKLVKPFRQRYSCRKIDKISLPFLAIGEHRKFKGWISTNYTVFATIFFDATSEILPKRKFKAILLDNVVEHIPRERAEILFRNCHKMLDHNGILRLATPDFAGFVEKYLDKDLTFLEAYKEELKPFTKFQIHNHIDLLRSTLMDWGHLNGYIYDYQTLKNQLINSGFEEIKIQQVFPGQSNFDFLTGLENRASSIEPQIVLEVLK